VAARDNKTEQSKSEQELERKEENRNRQLGTKASSSTPTHKKTYVAGFARNVRASAK
jgi:hypothetical protein